MSNGRIPVPAGDWSWLARCEHAVKPGQHVRVCVGPNAFECGSADSPGLLLALEPVFFQGTAGYSVDAIWAQTGAEPVALNLLLPLSAKTGRGDCLKVQIHDAWVLPQPAC